MPFQHVSFCIGAKASPPVLNAIAFVVILIINAFEFIVKGKIKFLHAITYKMPLQRENNDVRCL